VADRSSESGALLRVVHADADLLVVDKPAGLHTAPLHSGEAGTLLDQVLERYPEVASLPGVKPGEPGLLHRLDRGTSGLVVIARTAAAFHGLRGQFRSGRVRKEYLALCVPEAAVSPGERFRLASRFAPLGPGRRRVRVVLRGETKTKLLRRASKAVYTTEAEVVAVKPGLALVRAAIAQGFRHQVRAHLRHLGLPLLGDELYGRPAPSAAPQRLYLHAAAIELARPSDGRKLRIEAPLPPDFTLCYGGGAGEESG
jgi:23S rRNA pseudouridine1911/1915/1917 synthase